MNVVSNDLVSEDLVSIVMEPGSGHVDRLSVTENHKQQWK